MFIIWSEYANLSHLIRLFADFKTILLVVAEYIYIERYFAKKFVQTIKDYFYAFEIRKYQAGLSIKDIVDGVHLGKNKDNNKFSHEINI